MHKNSINGLKEVSALLHRVADALDDPNITEDDAACTVGLLPVLQMTAERWIETSRLRADVERWIAAPYEG